MQYRNEPLSPDFKGLFLAIMKIGGCKFGDGKTRGCPVSKKRDCSLAVGTQTQRVSTPPPLAYFLQMERNI